jgi:hypothetical protein
VAERDWQIKFPGSKNPMAPFLSQRHCLGSLMKELRKLIESYNRGYDSVSGGQQSQKIEDLLCKEYVKKMKCDEIFFQCNNSELWTQFEGMSGYTRAESQIIDEVSSFVLQAVFTSIASDFNTSSFSYTGYDTPEDVIYN